MKFVVKAALKASAQLVYSTWLNSLGHTAMTGGAAEIVPTEGTTFSAWDGYISGKNIQLEPFHRIVQSWRTTEFRDDEEDSIIELLLTENEQGTEITLSHSNLPEHGEQYIQGWEEHYFQPMKQYFLNMTEKENQNQ